MDTTANPSLDTTPSLRLLGRSRETRLQVVVHGHQSLRRLQWHRRREIDVARPIDPHKVEAEYGNQGSDFKGVAREVRYPSLWLK